MTVQADKGQEAQRTGGRTARTKGVSLLPQEYKDAGTVESLTGMGLSEVYRRVFAPQMHAAAQMLREVQESGVELNQAVLRDVWDIHMTADELTAVYSAESGVVLGD